MVLLSYDVTEGIAILYVRIPEVLTADANLPLHREHILLNWGIGFLRVMVVLRALRYLIEKLVSLFLNSLLMIMLPNPWMGMLGYCALKYNTLFLISETLN